jgi:hypothetical protein
MQLGIIDDLFEAIPGLEVELAKRGYIVACEKSPSLCFGTFSQLKRKEKTRLGRPGARF